MKDSRLQRGKGDNRMGSNCFLFLYGIGTPAIKISIYSRNCI